MTAPTQFRKKPVVISAIQWTGENLVDVIHFTDGRPPNNKSSHAGMMWEQYVDIVRKYGLKIFTMEGKMDASIGDWIIKGVKGEHYPCKPEIFALTYETKNEGADLADANVAAAYKAAAQIVMDAASPFTQDIAAAIHTLATQPQTDAMQAMVDAAVKEAREVDASNIEDMAALCVAVGDHHGAQTLRAAMTAIAKIGGAS